MTIIINTDKHCKLLARNLVEMLERFESKEIIAPVAFRSLVEYKNFCSQNFTATQNTAMNKIMTKYEDELGKPLLNKLMTAEPLLHVSESELVYETYINNKADIRKFIFENLDTKDKFFYLFKNIGK